nr:MAG TPA: hypothetical protein [Crassvirales sp.]DAO83149.1 MAG TPA: hypothetical protein [Bacteriophage sp.]DAQ87781.1 MAG TPA: hypothetical protein [Caudoviricetes sp.]DAV54028.1 MAG TPA: hypothetical protein [Caudoviricetes sp.]
MIFHSSENLINKFLYKYHLEPSFPSYLSLI